jgi:hypothetical protein
VESTINWIIICRAYLLVRRGHGAVGFWGSGVLGPRGSGRSTALNTSPCQIRLAGDLRPWLTRGWRGGRGATVCGYNAQVSGMLRRAWENQAPVGSPLSVGEDDPDLARGESHPLPGRGSEGGAAVGVRPGPVRGPGLTVAQDQGRA